MIFVSGTDNIVTHLNMIETIRDVGPDTVDQYMVQGWTLTEDNVTEESRGDCRTFNIKYQYNIATLNITVRIDCVR